MSCRIQDFENWDDVGLNISKPPDLLHLYLDYGKHTTRSVETADMETNVDLYGPEIAAVKDSNEQQVNELY